jgi:hypothetical protein
VILGVTGQLAPGCGAMQPEGPKASLAGFYSGASLDPLDPQGVRQWGWAGQRQDRESRRGNGVKYSDGEAS